MTELPEVEIEHEPDEPEPRYIDPNKADGDYMNRRDARSEGEARRARIESGQDTLDDAILSKPSTYSGSKKDLARLAARRGVPVITTTNNDQEDNDQ